MSRLLDLVGSLEIVLPHGDVRIMYLQNYGLNDSPFPSLPTLENYFDSDRCRQGLATVVSAVARQAGPNLIFGAPGTGKTMMLEVLANRNLGGRIVVFLRDLRIGSRRELLQNLLFELGLEFHGIDDSELRLALITALRSDSRLASGVLVLLDEAHLLSTEMLDQLRILSNVIRDGRSQIQWILAGNTSLEETLAAPELASFNQRIASRLYLTGFNLTEVEKYIDFQWRRAGGAQHPFLPDALQAIHSTTDGNPRLVNQLCEAVLLECRGARGKIDETAVQRAWANWQQIPIPEWLQTPTHGTDHNSEPSAPKSVVQFGSLDDADDFAEQIANKQVPRTTDNRSDKAQPQVAQPQVAQPQVAQPQVADPQVSERQVSDPQATERQVTIPLETETQVSEAPISLPPEKSHSKMKSSECPTPGAQPQLGDDSRSTIQETVAAQQVAQTQTLIRFAFEADIQKPQVPEVFATTDAATTAEPYMPSIERIQEKIDLVQQALTSLEQEGDPIEQMLIEADLDAVVHPLDPVTQSESQSPFVISNDPTIVFQDHLYMESLWVQNTAWSRQGKSADVPVQPTDQHDDPAPASIPYPSTSAEQTMPSAKEWVRDPDSLVPESTLPLGIRIDQESESGVNPPQSIKRRAPVPPIDSPQVNDWRNTLSDIPASEMILPTATFQDDASIIHRQAMPTEMPVDEAAKVHTPHVLEPPVLARRKDLRALLHALRGY